MIGGINNEPKKIGSDKEIEALKKDIEELKKTVDMLKYGLIFFGFYFLYNQFKKWNQLT